LSGIEPENLFDNNKKKFENFKNSNNKIMIILFFSFCIASPFQDPPQKFGLLMGGIEPPKKR
jgi:hypothetical protein